MKIHPFVRTSVQAASVGFAALASLACFVADPDPGGTVLVTGDAQTPADTGPVVVTDTGHVDSGPATGRPCRGDLDCTEGVRTHCILDPGREGFCVQCAPDQGFTCAAGSVCSAGVCVEQGPPPLTGPPCRDDSACTTGDRRHCVPDGTASGNRVCAQCNDAFRCDPGSTCASGLCVGQGALRFTLSWDRPGDMDLHVVTPAGHEIYYASRMHDGGNLDRDDTTQTGPENVFWASTPAPGPYLVCVVPFRVSAATNFTLTVARAGVEGAPIRGSRAASTGNVACSRTSPHFVTEVQF